MSTPNPADAIAPLPDVSAPASCVKGTVMADEVVMLGDSYMAAAFGNVGANIIADAQKAGSLPSGKNYREFYEAGASVNGGGASQLNIPYQYNTMAKGNTADNNLMTVTNPKDIKVVIMDGGGNDVLINQRSCLSDATLAALMADTACLNAINKAGATMTTLWNQMAMDGVKQLVFYWYPDLDPNGGGDLSTLPAKAPGVDVSDDLGADDYQKICCGSTFTPTATQYSCTGMIMGMQCTFVDPRFVFKGHAVDWIQADKVHPNAMGSTTIANLVWTSMVQNCVAQ